MNPGSLLVAVECSTWQNPRGYGRFTRELTHALLRAPSAHRFALVVDSGAAQATDLPDAPIVPVRTKRSVVDAATADGSRGLGDMWRMAARLSRGFDAVLFPTNYSFVPVRPGPLVALVIHDAMPETMPQLVLPGRSARLRWAIKNHLACRRADLIATVSEASHATIRRHLPVAGRPIAVLTEGAAAVFSEHGQPDDGRLVREATGSNDRFALYVGGLSPHKRVPDLIRAFGVVAGSQDGNLRLVLAGPDGHDGFAADSSGVGDAIASIGPLGQRVIRTGFVEDRTLAALYRAAECVVLPSMEEGFGLPAVEAMASGAPLIVADTPALCELCGPAAAYCSRSEDLASVLRRVLESDDERESLKRAGPKRAARFSWDDSARRLLDALDRAVLARAGQKYSLRSS